MMIYSHPKLFRAIFYCKFIGYSFYYCSSTASNLAEGLLLINV